VYKQGLQTGGLQTSSPCFGQGDIPVLLPSFSQASTSARDHRTTLPALRTGAGIFPAFSNLASVSIDTLRRFAISAGRSTADFSSSLSIPLPPFKG
jgi:hypothetical protein